MNDTFLKDSISLPWIDQIVDATSEHGMLSFIDVFSRYHQIPMFQSDKEKTAFVTPHRLYYYKVMSFELKNACATYQRLMTKIFKPLIGQTMEVYIDEIVVKSETRDEHAQYLEETFHLMRAYNMMLNPTKCVFGVNTEKFLRFMVSQRGIKVNSDQMRVILETPTSSSKKKLFSWVV